jgi:hypothetical protein
VKLDGSSTTSSKIIEPVVEKSTKMSLLGRLHRVSNQLPLGIQRVQRFSSGISTFDSEGVRVLQLSRSAVSLFTFFVLAPMQSIKL